MTAPASDRRIWHLLVTKPGREFHAEREVTALGARTLLPYDEKQVRTVKRLGRKGLRWRRYPILTGYLAAGFDDQAPWLVLSALPDLVGVVAFGGRPAVLTQADKMQIRSLHGKRVDQAGHRSLRAGDPVLITSGPFAGQETIISAIINDRIECEVMLFSQALKVEFGADSIERAA